jgi:integrase
MADHQRQPRLRAQLAIAMRARHYSQRTEKSYGYWIRRFIRFHDMRHPDRIGEEVASLMYGAGLRLSERARLRVKDGP